MKNEIINIKREKDYNIEFLRVLCCFLVICIHVANLYSRSYGNISRDSYVFSIIVNGVSRIAVPIFFMISGALLLEEPVEFDKNLNRVKDIFIVLLQWSFIYYFWNKFYLQENYDFTLLFQEPVKKHLWFLYALLGLYMTIPFWQCMLKNMSGQLMRYFAVLWIIFLTLNYELALRDMDMTYKVPLVGNSCYLGYFIMGYIIRHFIDYIQIKKRWCYAIATIAAVFTIRKTYGFSLDMGVHVERFFEYRNVMIGISATAVFLAIMRDRNYAFKGRTKKWIDVVSRNSFTIYLSHVLFLDLVREELHPAGIPSWIGIPLYAVGIFVVTLGFSMIILKGKKIFGGMVKKCLAH